MVPRPRQRNHLLDAELVESKRSIERLARTCGLDFFDVVFEVVEQDEMNMVAAYGGFPTRYPHWRFGMAYEELSRSSTYGLGKIYELVINNDPTFAYLLAANSSVEQKLVMAHVYGHADFFKNNLWFSRTDRKAIDTFANHASRIRGYIDRHGQDAVETFIDRALSLENLIDLHAGTMVRPDPRPHPEETQAPPEIGRLSSKDYMETFVNPPEHLERERLRAVESAKATERLPAHPVLDVLGFLIQHAPLKAWQQDILTIVRDEAQYFAPQAMTKILNEGWASYWHSRMMSGLMVASSSEIVDYADVHSSTLASSGYSLNPYKLGIELLRDIEDRWNKGRHGRQWELCDDREERATWDTKEMAGRDKIFQVRQVYNDIQLVDAFLTEDFCERHRLFGFGYSQQAGRYEIETRSFDEIKTALVRQLANRGNPIIKVMDANHANRGELYLKHFHEGIDLRVDWAREVLGHLRELWSRPVVLETKVDGNLRTLRHDGKTCEESSNPPA